MVRRHIYLDHNANTGVDPRVIKAILSELEEGEGNPSGIHYHGRRCRQRLEHSRETLARYLKVRPEELLFTSGGTEGANLLLHGFLTRKDAGHVITSDVEHACVYNTLKMFSQKGYEVSFLPGHLWGAVKPEAVRQAIRPDTTLITLMAVNNETGVKTDIDAIAEIAEERGIPFIVDGVALLGKEKFSVSSGVAAMFFSAHKFHGPKGIGFVFCRRSMKYLPLMYGGGQEFNRWPGTENLPGIVGLGVAVELLENQNDFTDRMRSLRDRLESGLKSNLDAIIINGEGPRVANTLNMSFSGVDGESLLMGLDMEGISVSHGSACSSGALEPSRILLNMGVPLTLARSAIRFSVSRETTEDEIDQCIDAVVRLVRQARDLRKIVA